MSKSLTQLIALFMILWSFTSKCNEGCLVCNASDNCSVCDIALGFVLEGNTCVKHEIANCDIPRALTTCYRCAAGHYLTHEGECKFTSVVVKNCEHYSEDGECSICQKGYYLSSNQCKAVTKTISDCIDYETDGKCSRCFYNLLSTDQTSCYEPPFETDFNCAYRYFPVTCNACKEGYNFADGFFLSDLAELNIKYTLLEKETYKSRNSYMNMAKCSSSSNSTSLQATCNSNFYRPEYCNTCEEGKYYDEAKGSCVDNPIGIFGFNMSIPYCYFMNNNQECEKCFEGYFLSYTNKVCLEHTQTVDNCKIMSQRKDSECFLCDQEYYLQSAKKCEPRNNYSLNCKTFNFFKDECLECKTGFMLSYENRICAGRIDHCSTYDLTQTYTICKKCDQDYYLIQNKCVAVPEDKLVDGCTFYDMSLDCVECEEDKALVEDLTQDKFVCTEKAGEQELLNCSHAIYSSGGGYECQSCDKNAARLKFINKCVFDEDSDELNCLEKDTLDQCIRCKRGYYLNLEDFTCIGGHDNNCEIYASSHEEVDLSDPPVCLKCSSGYYLFNNVCYQNLGTPSDGCIRKDANDNCLLCDSGYYYQYAFNHNEYYCKAKSLFPQHSNCDSLVWNPDLVNGPNFNCHKCQKGFFLTIDGECISCNEKNCKIISESGEVAEDSEGNCIIEKDETCIRYKHGVNAYITSNLQIVKFAYQHKNNIHKDINSYTSYANKTNYSSTYQNVFFESVEDFDNNVIKHATCKLGYARNFSVTNLTAQTNDCNVFIRNCNIRSNNLLVSPQRIYASCQSCYSGQAVFYTKDRIEKNKVDDIDSFLIDHNIDAYLPSTFCHPTTIKSTSIPHCGLFELALDDNGDIVASCLECQPGYKETSTDGIVTECTIISNCEIKVIGNQCERCSHGYSLNFNRNACIAYDPSDLNCLELASNNSCKKCLEGYHYNESNLCVKINHNSCDRWDGHICTKCTNPLEISLLYNPITINGSISCASGNTSLPIYCEIADINNACVKCEEGYLIDHFGNCFSENRISNCLDYDLLNGFCLKCAENYKFDISRGKCVPMVNLKSDNDCSIHYPYRLSANQGMDDVCVSNGIDDCNIYNLSALKEGNIKCTKCSLGYKLENEAISNNYKCTQFQPLPNCLEHSIDNSFNYICIKCIESHFVNRERKCEPRLPIPQCAEHHKIGKNCKRCNNGFYISEGQCAPRKNLTEGCLTYHPYKDECREYKVAHQYTYEFKDIIDDPPSIDPLVNSDGTSKDTYVISGCIKYFNKTICKTCSSNSYLLDNRCESILTSVEHCIEYSNATKCKKCKEGYTLIDNTCKATLAQNCLVYASDDKCATCPSTHPLLDEDFNCSKNPTVTFCNIYRNLETCALCDPGYYLDNGMCAPVTIGVPDCSIYKSKDECIECKKGFYLWLGKCKPNPSFDPHCENYRVTGQECSLCHPGYILIGNNCVKCGTNFMNCAVCSPEDTETCLMCRSGYHMNKELKCIENTKYKAFQPSVVIEFKTE